jgi:hypothetical protein
MHDKILLVFTIVNTMSLSNSKAYESETLEVYELPQKGGIHIVLMRILESTIRADTLRQINNLLQNIITQYPRTGKQNWRLVIDFEKVSLPSIDILNQIPEFNETMQAGNAKKVGLVFKQNFVTTVAIPAYVAAKKPKSETKVFYLVNDAVKFCQSQ